MLIKLLKISMGIQMGIQWTFTVKNKMFQMDIQWAFKLPVFFY